MEASLLTALRDTYPVEVAGVRRHLPLFEVAPGLRIAVLNILGDTELVEACARALAQKLAEHDYDILVTAEAKSIPLAHALSVQTQKPYVVLRKVYKPYMGVALSADTLSITTGEPQMLYLDEKDHELVRRPPGDLAGRRHEHRVHPGRDAPADGKGRHPGGCRGCHFYRRRPRTSGTG